MIIPITPITKSKTADYYELGSVVDSASARSVTATVTTVFGVDTLVLWEGDAYDEVGNWTQEAAQERITELLAAKYAE